MLPWLKPPEDPPFRAETGRRDRTMQDGRVCWTRTGIASTALDVLLGLEIAPWQCRGVPSGAVHRTNGCVRRSEMPAWNRELYCWRKFFRAGMPGL